MTESFIQSTLSQEDPSLETPLRPQSLDDFTGQNSVRKRLKVLIQAAKEREEALGHCLFCGPPGLGKTTLAHIVAKSMGTQLTITSGPVLEKPGDLAGILTNLNKGDVLFIDEIHRIAKNIEEYLYSAMEDFSLDLVIDSGPGARTVQLKLQPFTLVGATTRSGLLTGPMRSRFSSQLRLDFYDPENLQKILLRSAKLLKAPLTETAALEVGKRSRGTPRIANHLLRWVRDYSQIHHKNPIDEKTVDEALEMLSIDAKGLDEMDKKILRVIIDHHNGGPVGIQTIAVAIGEDPTTLSEVYEPFLILQGMVRRTPRGREVTKLGYEHLGLQIPEKRS